MTELGDRYYFKVVGGETFDSFPRVKLYWRREKKRWYQREFKLLDSVILLAGDNPVYYATVLKKRFTSPPRYSEYREFIKV